jgi:hypothetical protein
MKAVLVMAFVGVLSSIDIRARACDPVVDLQQAATDLLATLDILQHPGPQNGVTPRRSKDLALARQISDAIADSVADAECKLAALSGKQIQGTPADAAKLKDARRMIGLAKRWVIDWNAEIDSEVECRKTDQCVASEICEAMARRAADVQAIARERANPSGVVDLVKLHDVGEDIQAQDDIIKDGVALFPYRRGKSFAPSMCQPK